jgi:hypothetical protein
MLLRNRTADMPADDRASERLILHKPILQDTTRRKCVDKDGLLEDLIKDGVSQVLVLGVQLNHVYLQLIPFQTQ